jgi:tRNA1Val (adenine37-N6)-methyltransferase
MPRPFKFKQFTIHQEHAGMKVGTDSVLLGSWLEHDNPRFILDIGCGTGLLALMMAQRFVDAQILAIEIDPESLVDAKSNFTNSSWNDRLDLIEGDVSKNIFDYKFDLIVTNPPYFPVDTRSPEQKRALARSGVNFSFLKWLEISKDLLKKDGTISFVLPYTEWLLLKNKVKKIGMHVLRQCNVRPNDYKEVNRVLIELSLNSSKNDKAVEELKIENNKRHVYSKEYIDLTRSFYLNMD